MEIIYLDLHFLLNLLADYLVVLSAARVCSLRLKRIRYLLSALLGAVYSVLVLLPGFEFLSQPLSKLGCSLLMAYIAYGSEREPLRCFGVFLGISALFGGLVWAAGGRLPLKELMLCFALSYGLLSFFFKGRASLPLKKRVEVELELTGKKAIFWALVDTGNSLTDPISGGSVMVVCPQALKPLFPETAALLSLPATELLEISGQIPDLKGRFRLLPYKAVGGSGLLAAFKADKIKLDGKEEKELLIALSPSAAGDGFDAII